MISRRTRSRRLQTGLRDGGGGTFSPSSISGLKLWLRSNTGVTLVASPVTATGTTPPTITLTGTPIAGQSSIATPYVEIDCTLLGALGTWQFTWKLNGTVQQTAVVSATTVALAGSGLTANISAGTAATDNVWKANSVVSAWADLSAVKDNVSQATGSKQPIYLAADSHYNNQPSLSFATASSQNLVSAVAENIAQPLTIYVVGRATSTAGNYAFIDSASGGIVTGYAASVTSNTSYYAGTIVGSSTAVSSVSAMCFMYNGASSAMYVNTSVTAKANGNPGANAMGQFAVGGAGRGASFLQGDMSEILVFSGAHTQANVSRIFAMLSARNSPGSWN